MNTNYQEIVLYNEKVIRTESHSWLLLLKVILKGMAVHRLQDCFLPCLSMQTSFEDTLRHSGSHVIGRFTATLILNEGFIQSSLQSVKHLHWL